MGLIHIPVTLTPLPTGTGTYTADFLVDTGATDSMAPAVELRRIGVEPVGRKTYELADGSRIEYVFGLVRIEFMGEVTAGRIIFGPDDVDPLLGVTPLESVGITIDPASGTVRRLPAISLKRFHEREDGAAHVGRALLLRPVAAARQHDRLAQVRHEHLQRR